MNELLIRRVHANPSPDMRSPEGRVRIDEQGLIQWANTAAEKLFGTDALGLQGQHLSELTPTPEEDPLAPPNNEELARGQTCRLTFRHRNGYFFSATVRQAGRNEQQRGDRSQIHYRGDMPLDARVLRAAEQSTRLGIWELDAKHNRMIWSDGLYRLMDLDPGEPITTDQALFFFQEHRDRIRRALLDCIRHGVSFSLETPILTARQRRLWLRVGGHALSRHGKVYAVSGTALDITRLAEAQAQADAWRERARAIVQASEELVLVFDTQLELIAINEPCQDAFQRAFGPTPQVGDTLPELMRDHPHERRLYQRIWRRALERDNVRVEMPVAIAGEEPLRMDVRYQRHFDSDGQLLGAAQIIHRVRSSDLRQERPADQQQDPVTGLPNRAALIQALEETLGRQPTAGLALLYMDLDRFGELNAQFSPGACDRYLRDVAGLIRARLRQDDTIACIGGDRFVVLLENCGEEEARRVCSELQRSVADFVFDWRGDQLGTTVSVGLLPVETDRNYDPNALLALTADLCQRAKQSGRNRVHVHQDAATADAESEAHELMAQLEQAIQEDAIELYFQRIQPITSPSWGDHLEVLTRLRLPPRDEHEQPRYWEPSGFLPIAERFDLASLLDRRIIEKTLSWFDQHPALVPRVKMLSFNLSVASLDDLTLARFLEQRMGKSAYDLSQLCFEIRETDAVSHPEAADRCFRQLQSLGCQVALDGAGSSGQSYQSVSSLPVDYVKLDPRLMRNVSEDPVQSVLIDALHKVATVSHKQTIATQVENEETVRLLRQIGVHFGQGFGIAAVEPLQALLAGQPIARR